MTITNSIIKNGSVLFASCKKERVTYGIKMMLKKVKINCRKQNNTQQSGIMA